MDNRDAPEPEHRDVHIIQDVVPGAVAQAGEVKVELDRISQILNDVKGNTEATKNNTESIQRLIASSRKDIITTLTLGIAAIIIIIVLLSSFTSCFVKPFCAIGIPCENGDSLCKEVPSR